MASILTPLAFRPTAPWAEYIRKNRVRARGLPPTNTNTIRPILLCGNSPPKTDPPPAETYSVGTARGERVFQGGTLNVRLWRARFWENKFIFILLEFTTYRYITTTR